MCGKERQKSLYRLPYFHAHFYFIYNVRRIRHVRGYDVTASDLIFNSLNVAVMWHIKDSLKLEGTARK